MNHSYDREGFIRKECNFVQKWLHSRLRKVDRDLFNYIMGRTNPNEHLHAVNFFMMQEGMEHWECSCGRPAKIAFLNEIELKKNSK